MKSEQYEQLELPLEWPVPSSHYTVELRSGNVHALDMVRSNEATDVDGALNLIEAFRDLTRTRNSVTWQDDSVNAEGILYGLAPGGLVWQISVVPPLSTELK